MSVPVSKVAVALRKESVDRNTNTISDYLRANVALRKESVDRNKGDQGHISGDEQSLSARRAWIEIWYWGLRQFFRPVALRKESVDRNKPRIIPDACGQVALRKESVDRNIAILGLGGAGVGRSPQGERG